MKTLEAPGSNPDQPPIEREAKYAPSQTLAQELEEYRADAQSIEQLYLSHPAERFSLRLRRQSGDVSATLKIDEQPQNGSWLARQEIETPLSPDAFAYFADQHHYPTLRKERVTLLPGVICDWIEGVPQPLVEVDAEADSDAFQRLASRGLTAVTHQLAYRNESIAHALQPDRSSNLEYDPSRDPDALELAGEIVEHLESSDEPYVIGIRGRSGSGKTTLAHNLELILSNYTDVVRLSTDDYHRGKQWLLETFGVERWDNWDASVVYNSQLLARELGEYLTNGEPIAKRHFDFATEEPVIERETHPTNARVVIVEGLYPHDAAIQEQLTQLVELETPIATSIGRRILRDAAGRLNDSLGSAGDILRYQLETAEPTYQQNS